MRDNQFAEHEGQDQQPQQQRRDNQQRPLALGLDRHTGRHAPSDRRRSANDGFEKNMSPPRCPAATSAWNKTKNTTNAPASATDHQPARVLGSPSMRRQSGRRGMGA